MAPKDKMSPAAAKTKPVKPVQKSPGKRAKPVQGQAAVPKQQTAGFLTALKYKATNPKATDASSAQKLLEAGLICVCDLPASF